VTVEKFSTGSAKNARYATECPSISSRREPAEAPWDAAVEVGAAVTGPA
jgi:hypothetical protein